ncbi:hypothetical protein AC1031_011602 [Aphanomyces cochlioides]|nr:hypothetical protein AC1031_011602 [Aphanomyces cochlioides]
MATVPTMPTKETIQDAFLGASTRRTYSTYQRQFEEFLRLNKPVSPINATHDDCTDFLHHLYSMGRKARTIDSAKTALVAYFKNHNIDPNPAQASQTKRYVVGLQKFNRQNKLEDEKKAHPLTVYELSRLMDAFANLNPFVGSMYRFFFSACYFGCFRISEMLALTWSDVNLVAAKNSHFVSIRLRWHKKASVEKECQIYNLVDEQAFPCLRVCAFYNDYVDKVRACIMNVAKDAFVFPQITGLVNGNVKLAGLKQWNKITCAVSSMTFMRRGGSFYRVFESPERKFNFRELMAWCRWTDVKTCCEYLVTKSISDTIDPRNLLQKRKRSPNGVEMDADYYPLLADDIAQRVLKYLQTELSKMMTKPTTTVQTTIHDFAAPRMIPTAHSANEAWDQWFIADAKVRCYCALKDFTKSIIKADRKKYSERLTIASAFGKYQTFYQFEQAYTGHTNTSSNLLKEVRKRKAQGRL